MSETLEQKLRANKARSIAQADATANKERQQKIQQQQQLQKQAEENSAAYKKYQKDLAEYEKQQKEYDAAVKQLEAEKKAEAEKAAVFKAAEQKRIADQKAINDKYDAQIAALGAKPSKYYYKPKYYTNRYTGHTRLIGHTRESNHRAIKNYNSKVDAINRERAKANSNFNLANSDLPQWAKTKAAREWNPVSYKNTSAVALAQRYYDSFLAESERKRQSSITTAKSNAVKAREQHEKTIREYEAKRDSAPVSIPSVIDKPLTPAAKTRPKVHPSSYFKNTEKTPVSIFGTTPLQSKKAEETFENTQLQQKELFTKVTGAASWNDAISHRKDAMKNNPYVGTANTIFEKGKEVGSSGVLIEKKARVQDVFQELAEPISQKQEINHTLIGPPKPQEITYVVTTPDGKTKRFSDKSKAESFAQTLEQKMTEESYYLPGSLEYLYGTKQEKNYTIQEILQGNNDNSNPIKDIEDAAKNPIHNIAQTFMAIPEAITRDFKNGFKPDSQGRTPGTAYFEDEISPKLKPTLLDSLISGKPTGRSDTFNVASALIEAALFAAPIPGMKGVGKIRTITTDAKNKNKAQELGEQIFETIQDKKLAEQLEDGVIYRKVSPRLAKAIANFNRDTPVGVERIDDSFLITAGTESKTPQPSILYNPKGGKSTVFTPVPEDHSIAPRGILVRGKSAKEFSDAKKLDDDISYAPGMQDNLEKISNPSIEKYLKPEALITDVSTSFLEKYPKVATFGADKQNSNLFVTTEVRNLVKGFEADVKRLDAPDSAVKKTKNHSKDKSSFEESVKDIIGAEKNRGSLQTTKGRGLTVSKHSPSKSSKPNNTKSQTKQSQSDISIIDETILHSNRPKAKFTSTPMLDSLLDQQQSISFDVTPKSKSDYTVKLDDMLSQDFNFDHTIIAKLEQTQDTKQRQILYDLLVQQGKMREKPRFRTIPAHKQRTKTTLIITPTTTNIPTTKTPPVSIKIPEIGIGKSNNTKKKKGRHAAKYSIWNVDIDNIGTLPGDELVTSKSTKIFKDLDRRQKAHSKSTSKSKTRKTVKKSTKKKSKRNR